MADLNTDIRYIKGVGEARAKSPADGKTVRSSTLSGTYRRGSTPAARP